MSLKPVRSIAPYHLVRNDKLDPDFLRWQIREMDRQAWADISCMPGRIANRISSEEWMECIRACIDEGINWNGSGL